MPARTPTFFVDRSLGRYAVPQALRAAGWDIVVHDDHYGTRAADVADVEWLGEAGTNGWSVLIKDERIRYRAAEQRALVDAGVHVFCLSSGNLRGPQMAELFSSTRSRSRRSLKAPVPPSTQSRDPECERSRWTMVIIDAHQL